MKGRLVVGNFPSRWAQSQATPCQAAVQVVGFRVFPKKQVVLTGNSLPGQVAAFRNLVTRKVFTQAATLLTKHKCCEESDFQLDVRPGGAPRASLLSYISSACVAALIDAVAPLRLELHYLYSDNDRRNCHC